MPRLSREALRIIMLLMRKTCQYLTQTGAILFVWDPIFSNSSGLKIMIFSFAYGRRSPPFSYHPHPLALLCCGATNTRQTSLFLQSFWQSSLELLRSFIQAGN